MFDKVLNAEIRKAGQKEIDHNKSIVLRTLYDSKKTAIITKGFQVICVYIFKLY